MAFREIQFPPNISFGATIGGPDFNTDVAAALSGFEQRNQRWAESRGHWNAGYGAKTKNDFEAVDAFFRASAGMAHGFRWKDWANFEVTTPVLIGVGDGSTKDFQLVKVSTSGPDTYTRTVKKPVAGTIRTFLDTVEKFDPADFTTDTTTGIVSYVVALGVGVEATALFEFDTPARFNTDHMGTLLHTADIMEWPEIPVVEIRV